MRIAALWDDEVEAMGRAVYTTTPRHLEALPQLAPCLASIFGPTTSADLLQPFACDGISGEQLHDHRAAD